MSLGFFTGRRASKSKLGEQLELVNTMLEIAVAAKSARSEQTNSVTTEKLEIDLAPDCKVWIDDLANELQQTRDVITKYNQSRGADGLLAALQAEAASDSPESDDDLLDLGQWVFEGQDDKWIGAAVDKDGKGFLFSCNSNLIERGASCWTPPEVYEILPLPGLFNAIDWDKSFIDRDLPDLDQSVFDGQDEQWVGAAVDKDGNGYLFGCDSLNVELRPSVWQPSFGVDYKVKLLHGKFNAIDWDKSFIDRQAINDVDFEDTQSEEKEALEYESLGVNPSFGASVDWYAVLEDEDSTPELSYDDLQHIFVQNLTTVLVQRMHSLDRFSGEDKVIKFGSLLPWDILYVPTSDPAKKFSVATHPVSGSLFVGLDVLPRTIYESEIEEFKKWAEAYYHYV